jgi:D-glycero-beta-D-manno-heptose-7-phosphate kinase
MKESAHIQPQKQFKILCLGDTCDDVYHYGNIDRISPEAPIPIFVPTVDKVLPGMAANVSKNLKSLGCDVTEVFGNKSIKRRFVDVKTKTQILRVDEDNLSTSLKLKDLPDSNFDCVVISDYEKGTISYDLISDIKRKYSVPIFIDTKKTDLKQLNGCFVKINLKEYDLLKSYCDELIVTLGERGVRYKNDIMSTKRIDVIDVCGAGDTFLSALAYQYLNTRSIKNSILFAQIASSITVKHFGVYAPTLGEIYETTW